VLGLLAETAGDHSAALEFLDDSLRMSRTCGRRSLPAAQRLPGNVWPRRPRSQSSMASLPPTERRMAAWSRLGVSTPR
jgi:hypothetical protein